ncbi:TetR/AcrR family transcriptional regulator [Microbacterium sp. ABRD28]|uniref:TetR/AcrR family transcriptional regulator n=1 Tax=Microbacterium sp. ABRD28 TaxID=2268461 RepID=UPI000F54DD8A|nr:TetR/AcrR family transcriptional regulator [Microbacterium sp. ABRD28]AZC14903.1 TetR/AcrR family transcriptional regulator [Microbacterium sp. ABRD28]
MASSSSTTTSPGPARRMSSDERREQIVAAAIAIFGARGYEGTTTDDVARAAGVSQPYVVRLFGSKESLFLAALAASSDALMSAFRQALADEASDRDLPQRIGDAYVQLVSVRGLHQTLSHAWLLGSHPVIGPAARTIFADVWQFFREEVGFSADEASTFLAQGMLINVMIGMRLVDSYDTDARIAELLQTCFPSKLPQILDVAPRADEPW